MSEFMRLRSDIRN